MRKRHEQYLLDITSLPTAAGKEDRVSAWIRDWARRRRNVTLKADCYGNLVVKRKGVSSPRPIFFTAHLDHPAFVVKRVLPDGKTLVAQFLGGVQDDYFSPGTPVAVYHSDLPAQKGRLVSLDCSRTAKRDQQVTVRFARKVTAQWGDLMTWALPASRIAKGRLHAPACDDLAAVAAAIAAYERLLAKPRGLGDVRLLFTRAEEVGFIGAIGATKTGIIPKRSTLICLENSKSFAESPIGGGPIIRVGDRLSIFNPALNARLVTLAQGLAKKDKTFRFQRKLMPGGACEATAFTQYGYLSTCLCLPLGNYHNMDEARTRIAPETIALSDYHQLVDLLEAAGRRLDTIDASGDLTQRLDGLFERRRSLVE